MGDAAFQLCHSEHWILKKLDQPNMFYEGTTIGPYTLITVIGRGGFGEVWLGEGRTELLTNSEVV